MIIVEGLAGLIRKEEELGEFSWFLINDGCKVNLLQFSDDTLFIGEGCWKNIWSIKAILICFQLVLGLSINFQKSRIIGVNIISHLIGSNN